MLKSILQKISQIAVKSIRWRFWKFNVCASIAMGLAIANVIPAIAGMKIEGLDKAKLEIAEIDRAESVSSHSPFADGVYLFGRSPQAGQYGVTYLVFAVRQGTTRGAFYEVASEYSCFSGTVENQNLNLSVEDIDGTIYPYAIALEDRGAIATNNGLMRIVGLQGYHPLAELSNLDRDLLQSCADR